MKVKDYDDWKVLFFSNSRFLINETTFGKCHNCKKLLSQSQYQEHFVYACAIKLQKDSFGKPQLIDSVEKLKKKSHRKRICINCFISRSRVFCYDVIDQFIHMSSEEKIFHKVGTKLEKKTSSPRIVL